MASDAFVILGSVATISDEEKKTVQAAQRKLLFSPTRFFANRPCLGEYFTRSRSWKMPEPWKICARYERARQRGILVADTTMKPWNAEKYFIAFRGNYACIIGRFDGKCRAFIIVGPLPKGSPSLWLCLRCVACPTIIPRQLVFPPTSRPLASSRCPRVRDDASFFFFFFFFRFSPVISSPSSLSSKYKKRKSKAGEFD